MAFSKVKGTSDYFPEDMRVKNYVFGKLSDTARRFRFEEISFPAIETMQLLTKKSGEEIKQQIFRIEKQGKEELGLRFEATATSARMFIERQKQIPKPVRWFCLISNWRYERPQKGRDREFFQFNAEIYGCADARADSEVISLAIESLKSLGLKEEDFVVKINNRKLLSGFIMAVSKKKAIEGIIRIIDKRQKITPKEFHDELAAEGLDGKSIEKLERFIGLDDINEIECLALETGNELAAEGIAELKGVFSCVKCYKNVRVVPSIARGLDYYTGTVFEIFDVAGKYRSLAGGGRYDNMIEIFGGQPEAATGFAIGYSTVSLLLRENNLLPALDEEVDYYVACVNAMTAESAFEIASMLRKKYIVGSDIVGRQLKKQFNEANVMKAKKVVIIGEEELKSGSLKVKDMASGEEKTVKIERFLKEALK